MMASGRGGQPGTIDIDGNVLVERAVERAAVDEDVGGGRAGADGDDGLGSADLVIDGLDGADRVAALPGR